MHAADFTEEKKRQAQDELATTEPKIGKLEPVNPSASDIEIFVNRYRDETISIQRARCLEYFNYIGIAERIFGDECSGEKAILLKAKLVEGIDQAVKRSGSLTFNAPWLVWFEGGWLNAVYVFTGVNVADYKDEIVQSLWRAVRPKSTGPLDSGYNH